MKFPEIKWNTIGWAFIWSTIASILVAIVVFCALSLMKTAGIIPLLGLVAFLIAFVIFVRPLNIQSAVIIAFIALMFNGLGTFWQKENFDLRNRPYVGIVPAYFDMMANTVDGKNKILTLKIDLQNTGDIGAILEDFEYILFVTSDGKFFNNGTEKMNAINLRKLNEQYGVIEWKNAPLYPRSHIGQEIINNPFGLSDFQKLGGGNENVFLWFKATYRPIGESKLFHFWTVIKTKGSTEFRFISSGEDNYDFVKKYKIN